MWKENAADDFPYKSEKGPSSDELPRQRKGKFRETGPSSYGPFRAHRYHAELN